MSSDNAVLKVLGGLVFVVGAAFGAQTYIMGEVEAYVDNRVASISTNYATLRSDVDSINDVASQNARDILIRSKYIDDGTDAIRRLSKLEAGYAESQFSATDRFRRMIGLEMRLTKHLKDHDEK